MLTYSAAGRRMERSALVAGPTYSLSSGVPSLSTSSIAATPQSSATLAAHRTTLSASTCSSGVQPSAQSAVRAIADAYKLVVATLRKAKR